MNLYILYFLRILEYLGASVKIIQVVGQMLHHARQFAEERDKSYGELS